MERERERGRESKSESQGKELNKVKSETYVESIKKTWEETRRRGKMS